MRSWSFSVLAACALFVAIPSCRARERTDARPAPSAPPSAAPAPSAAPPASANECAADDDCRPLNCCYALEEHACIPRARAHCDGFEIDCAPYNGIRYRCTCAKGRCVGSVTAGAIDAGPPAAPKWASGALSQEVVLKAIIAHGPDVRACKALAKKASGSIFVTWNVAPSGAVEKATVAMSSMPKNAAQCLTKKIGAWRFPKARGPTHVTYEFRFGG